MKQTRQVSDRGLEGGGKQLLSTPVFHSSSSRTALATDLSPRRVGPAGAERVRRQIRCQALLDGKDNKDWKDKKDKKDKKDEKDKKDKKDKGLKRA